MRLTVSIGAPSERVICVPEVVPRLVECQIFDSVDFAQLGHELLQLLVGADRQQSVVGAFVPVLLDNPQRNIQQPHDRFRAGLLSSDMYPSHTLRVLRNVLSR